MQSNRDDVILVVKGDRVVSLEGYSNQTPAKCKEDRGYYEYHRETFSCPLKRFRRSSISENFGNSGNP